MKLIIAGGRDFDDYQLLVETMSKLYIKSDDFLESIISGLAQGADTLGIRYADEHGIPVERFPAYWNGPDGKGPYNRAAGYQRNERMAEHATHLLAFWDGESRGTMHMIKIARKKGLPVKIVEYGDKHDV